jgi:hypothetical protein
MIVESEHLLVLVAFVLFRVLITNIGTVIEIVKMTMSPILINKP